MRLEIDLFLRMCLIKLLKLLLLIILIRLGEYDSHLRFAHIIYCPLDSRTFFWTAFYSKTLLQIFPIDLPFFLYTIVEAYSGQFINANNHSLAHIASFHKV